MNSRSIPNSALSGKKFIGGLLLVLLLVLAFAAPVPVRADGWFVVNTTSDDDSLCYDNHCTLRGAMVKSNTFPGKKSIVFNIPRDFVHTITLKHELPMVSDVNIQGYSQNGARVNKLAVGDNSVHRIQIRSIFPVMFRLGSGVKISGLAMNGSANTAIHIVGDDNILWGNFIGLTAIGFASDNKGTGILIQGNNNRVGGTELMERNIISAIGSGYGIIIEGKQNLIQGNYIGTTRDGTGSDKTGNGNFGILIHKGKKNQIGGDSIAARNVISGNAKGGIEIINSDSNRIQGNYIGLAADGTTVVPNGADGISISDGSKNKIGGIEQGAGNMIAFNEADGVEVTSGTRNQIRGNSIFSNWGLGIDLNGDGVTANDRTDTDGGANEAINFPTFKFAQAVPAGTHIKVQLKSTPNKPFSIQLYSSTFCDSAGYGEGKTFLGSPVVWTDANGNATESVTLSTQVPVGHVITATTTDGYGNTSEFSKCETVVPKK